MAKKARSKKRKTTKKSVKKVAKKRVKKTTQKRSPKKSTPVVEEKALDIGKASFVFGVVLALIIGVIMGVLDLKVTLGVGVTYSIILLLGIVVGILNITTAEINEFLIASITFLVAANVNIFVISLTLPVFGGIVKQVLLALSIFVAPAATIVALKAIYELARKV